MLENTQQNDGPRVPDKSRTLQSNRLDTLCIGARVRCNSGFAAAFEGQEGTITDTRQSVIDGRLWVIKFDTPTAAAAGWPALETLAAPAYCYDLI